MQKKSYRSSFSRAHSSVLRLNRRKGSIHHKYTIYALDRCVHALFLAGVPIPGIIRRIQIIYPHD